MPQRRTAYFLVTMIGLCRAMASAAEAPAAPSFRNDVMAVLSKLGCNSGTCHGNLSGKGGFKISLRGEDPEGDYYIITRDQFARRTDPADPLNSLLLLKATAAIPHEGGKRTSPDSPEYRMLRDWIAAGAPRDSQSAPLAAKLTVEPAEKVIADPVDRVQLKVTATYSDGSQRDLTSLAVYEPTTVTVEVSPGGLVQRKKPGETAVIVRYLNLQQTVRLAFIPDRPDFVFKAPPAAGKIDQLIFAKLQSVKINPSPICDDATFLRRAYLDLIGVIPTADEARRFMADRATDKRAKLIDTLLARPEYADYWSLKWADLLRIEEKVLDKKGVAAFHAWVRQSIAENKPMDRFVSEILTATGSTYQNAPANYYRSLRDPSSRVEAVAQVFLGTRMQCARCHNHPFERWTMDDYYGMASLFSRIDYKIIENKRTDKNDRMQFIGEQIVNLSNTAPVTHPRTNQPARPRFLGSDVTGLKDTDNRLDRLAEWVVSPQNPLFARAMVNRVWSHLMGRGIVEPVDDLRASNPPSNPELLDALARDLAENHFDLRRLIRRIAASTVYQLDWRTNDTNADDTANFSHGLIRRLTAEQMLDSVAQLTGSAMKFDGVSEPLRASQMAGVTSPGRSKNLQSGDRFLKLFGKPPRLLNCECERVNETALGQVIELTSGPAIAQALADPQNRLARILKEGDPPTKMIDELYWSALSRPPASAESNSLGGDLDRSQNRRATLEDIGWALINSKEFLLRR